MRLEAHIEIPQGLDLIAAEGDEQKAFLNWASQHSKIYESTELMQERFKIWKDNNKKIREFNAQSVSSGKKNPVILKHTKRSDQTLDELTATLASTQTEGDRRRLENSNHDSERNLAHEGPLTAQTHDWSHATLPVKDECACSVPFIFAGNTVIEATEYINQVQTSPQKISLSEQLVVDCGSWDGYSGGCASGDAKDMFDWYQQSGTVEASAYPYLSGITCAAHDCQFPNSADRDQGLVTGSGELNTMQDMVDMIAERPLVGRFSVDPFVFNFYSFGLIENGSGMGCNSDPDNSTNHQMVIAGYDQVGQGGIHHVKKTSDQIYGRFKTPQEF